MARWEHFWLMIGFVGFFCSISSQVIRAGWDNFRSMVAGFSLVKMSHFTKGRGTLRRPTSIFGKKRRSQNSNPAGIPHNGSRGRRRLRRMEMGAIRVG